ncbi:MAG: hypothetical protein RIG61_11625 [Deltaproteobacteria bacterium]
MNFFHNKDQSIIKKITNLLPVPEITGVSSGETGHNDYNSYIYHEYDGSEPTNIMADGNETENIFTASGNAPLEYLYLLYRL